VGRRGRGWQGLDAGRRHRSLRSLVHDQFAITDLLAQVRLEPRGLGSVGPHDPSWARFWTGDPDFDDWFGNLLAGEDGWDPGPWLTLEPRGVHRRRSILERLDRAAARRLIERWDPSLFSGLRSNHPLLVNFSATGPGAPELHWQVDPRLLGRSVTISIDGEPHSHVLRATRGRLRLPALRGRHRLELEIDAEPNRRWAMWIDRPVLGQPPISRHRAIHELNAELLFPLVKPGPEPLIVNVVVYLPRRRPHAELSLSVDRGDPERRSGVLDGGVSVPERRFFVDGAAAYEARDRDRPVDARTATRVVDLETRPGAPLDVVTLQVTLGEDVVAGPHELRVKLLDGGGRIWVRAFHRGLADRRRPAASWTERGADQP
jgi:hypothetical protein